MPTTNSAYGTGDNCTEESPLNPISRYAIDKVEVEKEYGYLYLTASSVEPVAGGEGGKDL